MSEPQGSEGTEGTTRPLPVVEKATGTGTLDQNASAAAFDPPPPVLDGENGANGRFWSARRVPAAVVAVLLLVLAGAFLYDVVAVRTDRSAMEWRRELARQLAERPLDDTWVLVGAGVAVALGLWLVVLATTPGLRAVLPMTRTHPDVRAGLDREAAALALRDRAMEISGVQSVGVRMGRRRADVRAVSHFRDLDDVRADLDDVLAEAIRGLGLSRPPALSVHVRRPGRKG
ncbi:hypothetical protein BN159_6692 [Streptomyces davaonensis JCM 4913]|uniref:DUF6286 domain-containing protein n=1 Tax=Streptomyces davaonensis (strain DSM 101723 / JCM 4913 / KCC S-0913 / 768) TaxID=1214101 RepID=K4R468_STRDJ|nr:DUF6286 domain-containing protein [Streptomyces davaonensis]CCK31071.1 hypothetical protein BN159_6692 [Streptomyces davaonensis JCM 4913]